jgi:hypothetical protein
VGLFSRSKSPHTRASSSGTNPGVGKVGPGRRLRSSENLDSGRRILEDIIESYGTRQYPELSRVVLAGWEWYGPDDARPEVVLCGPMQDGHPGFIALRRVPEGTEAGIYDLTGEMSLPIIGHWKMRDKSLTSIGEAAGGQLALTAPSVPDDYVEELVQRLGLPTNIENWTKAATELHQMFVLKAVTFMQQAPQSVADMFIDDHRNVPLGIEGLRVILRDLARWNTGVIPYMQDVPPRVRALILQVGHLNELG